MGAVLSCIKSVFRAIGNAITAVVNGIGGILKAIINGVTSVITIIVSCLTCGRSGRGRTHKSRGMHTKRTRVV
ncbi:hypothetical protein Q9L58_004985 [Maublancomyces gigas]|uniref:Uncharacterized protein n=1 Tax=Discina gigas TaxID=1032678 RepID=A0ABR3GJG9_9PEZI